MGHPKLDTVPSPAIPSAAPTAPRSGIVPKFTDSSSRIPKLWDEEEDPTGITGTIPGNSRAKGQPRLTVMTGLMAGMVISLDAEVVIGRSRGVDLRLEDEGVSRRHCRITRRGAAIFVEDAGSKNGTLLNGTKVTTAQIVPGDRLQIGAALLQLGVLDDTEDTLARRLFDASTRDPLTRAMNRSYFGDRLDAEIASANRQGGPISVLLLDLDGLKDVNDAYGPVAGDDLLRAVVKALGVQIPEEDFCRYAGDEIAFLVRESIDDAVRIAERIRSIVENVRTNVGRRTLQITGSIGVAQLGERGAQLTGQGLMRVAEKRMRRAKDLGKNRVCAV
jgi:diguanylate cyclase (GGDEF)-like protein